jgi:signal transduction histidine kinase
LDKIFDPFFTTKKDGEGTGLGLSVSHSIIKKHGGRMEVQSTPGEGTMFSIFIPLERPSF